MASHQFDVTPEKEGSLLGFLRRQLFFVPKPVAGISLAGKTAIVTGSNGGIGLEVSRQLLDLGLSRLILAVRNEDKGRAASAGLLKNRDQSSSSSSSSPIVEVWSLDLASYPSIVAFAERAQSLERMDIAVMNAAIVRTTNEVNLATGHNETIQVNYLSTALLTILLLSVAKTKNAAQGGVSSRITITSSDVASWTFFKEKSSDPLLPAFGVVSGNPADKMMVSKLLGQLFLTELTRRVPSSVAVINCATPGLVHDSQFNREIEQTFGGKIFKILAQRIGYTSAIGARNITDAAVNHGEQSHGQYLSTQRIKPMAPIIYTEQGRKTSERLWAETMAEFSFAKAEHLIAEMQS